MWNMKTTHDSCLWIVKLGVNKCSRVRRDQSVSVTESFSIPNENKANWIFQRTECYLEKILVFFFHWSYSTILLLNPDDNVDEVPQMNFKVSSNIEVLIHYM
jgi:hypothetical protein